MSKWPINAGHWRIVLLRPQEMVEIVHSDNKTMNQWRWIRSERRHTVRTVRNTGPSDETPAGHDEPLANLVTNSFIVI